MSMKHYQSSQRVLAREMTYGDFARMPQVEAMRLTTHYQDSPGYMVESPVGISAHEGYAGKLRWIPKAEFDCTHIDLSEYSHLDGRVLRVAVERHQLNTRLAALVNFTKDRLFMALPTATREDLLDQSRHMTKYSMVLDSRMERFQKEYEHKQRKAA